MWKLELVENNYQIITDFGVYLSTFQSFKGYVPYKWDVKHHTPQKVQETIKYIWGEDLDISGVVPKKKRDWFEVGDKVRLKANCEDEDLKVFDDLYCNEDLEQHIHEVRGVYADGRHTLWLKGYGAVVSASDIELIGEE